MITGHGDDIYSQSNEIKYNFSSNMYSRQNHAALQSHLCASIHTIHSYPEPDAHSLVQLLAEKHQIESSHVLVTNGAVEAIYLIAQAYRGKRSTIVTPTFSEYEDACSIHQHQLTYVKCVEELSFNSEEGVEEARELIWLCNPNNPNGNVCDKKILEKLIATHPESCFVIDQSYESFTSEVHTFTAAEALKYKNLILLHSMTKSYAIPGLRLGYITAPTALLENIGAYRMPWSVNQLAIEAGKYLLTKGEIGFNLADYLAETNRLMGELNAIEGVTALPTHTHFFLCKLTKGTVANLKRYLVDKHGILIRDAANFRGLDASYFRIAAQSTEENNLLVKAIKEWI